MLPNGKEHTVSTWKHTVKFQSQQYSNNWMKNSIKYLTPSQNHQIKQGTNSQAESSKFTPPYSLAGIQNNNGIQVEWSKSIGASIKDVPPKRTSHNF